MQINNKIFTEEKSASEKGTSFAEMNRSACSNAKQGPTKQYNAFKDFHDSETTAHILAAWMQFTGMNGIEGFRKYYYLSIISFINLCVLITGLYLASSQSIILLVIEEKKKVVSAEAILTLRHLMLVDVFVL